MCCISIVNSIDLLRRGERTGSVTLWQPFHLKGKRCQILTNFFGKNKYICVESYRNETEQFGAESWALTAKTIIDKKSWKWLFEVSNYKGEYEFIYFA